MEHLVPDGLSLENPLNQRMSTLSVAALVTQGFVAVKDLRPSAHGTYPPGAGPRRNL